MSDIDALVEVNPRLMQVILRHLLTNADHAVAHQERRRIDLRVYLADQEVCCEIQDSGPGLPAPNWTAAFAPFYSTKGLFAHDSSQARLDALGLGLTVSQHLATLHGGRLELRSHPGNGTTAILTLPLWTKPLASAPSAIGEPLRADVPVEGKTR
jgi:C4-dicarboxylate-specific signal transduction histidine kinase